MLTPIMGGCVVGITLNVFRLAFNCLTLEGGSCTFDRLEIDSPLNFVNTALWIGLYNFIYNINHPPIILEEPPAPTVHEEKKTERAAHKEHAPERKVPNKRITTNRSMQNHTDAATSSSSIPIEEKDPEVQEQTKRLQTHIADIQKEHKTSDDLHLQLEYFEKVTKYRHPHAIHQQYAKEVQEYKCPTTLVELQSATTNWKARLEEMRADNEKSLAALSGLRRHFPAKQQSGLTAGFYSRAYSSSSRDNHPSASGPYNYRSNKNR